MKTIVRTVAVLSALTTWSLSAIADEDEAAVDNEAAEESSGDDEEASDEDGEVKAKKKSDKIFHILPFCRLLDGYAEVVRPGEQKVEPIREGKFYPLGSTFRTRGSQAKMVIQFGKDVDVELNGDASFATRAQPLGEQSRTVILGSGTLDVKLPRNFPDGLFVVTTPAFKVVDLKGDSRYVYTKSPDGDGDTASVRCVTGDLTLEGRHYKILTMKAANEVKIRTTKDELFTGIYGIRGDYIVRLDQGRRAFKDFATGETKEEEKVLDWKMSPKTAIRIHRAIPALGEKMAVTVMTFDAAGELKNRCAFTEHTVEINSGELGPTSKKEREELAKKAAEATEGEESGEATSSSDAEEKEDEEKSNSSSDDDDDF